MPRRMIDSEIWRNEKVGNLPDAGRLLFIGIFSNADDDGRLKASAKFLKATIFPYDADKSGEDIKQLRDQCATLGLIRLYSKDGREYLDLPGWREHQFIRKDRYKPSQLPPFDEASQIRQPSGNQVATTGNPGDNQMATTGCRSIVKSNLIKSKAPPFISPPKTHETLPDGKVGGESPPAKVQEIFDLWNSLGVIKHKKLSGQVMRAVSATLRDFSAADVSQAMKNYALILNDEQCYFKYRWTLKDFLKRGLEKFLDFEVALGNYRREKGGSYGARSNPKFKKLASGEELEQSWNT